MTATADCVSFEQADRGFAYAIARRLVRDPDDADDVTQEALLLAYRHRLAFRGDSGYRTWLYRIVATTALSHLRRQRRARVAVVANDGEQRCLDSQVDPAKSPPALIEEAENCAGMQRALAELDASYRDVLLARRDAGECEVAKMLGISVGNVKIRAHRARKQLRAMIERRQEISCQRSGTTQISCPRRRNQ